VTVQKDPTPEIPVPFRWTPRRRQVLKLYVRGCFIKDIAKTVHMSRATIHTWVKAPEFQIEVGRLLAERHTGNSMKQSYFTSKVASELSDRYLKTLERFKRAQLNPRRSRHRLDIQGTLLEHLEKLSKEIERMRNQHRIDHGIPTSVSKHTSVVQHQGTVEHQHEHKLSFRDYLESHKPQLALNPASTPTQQLLDATVQTMQGTDYLERLAERENIQDAEVEE
jgi:hypothetical protein